MDRRSIQSGDSKSGRDVCSWANWHIVLLPRRGGRFLERVLRGRSELLGAGNTTGVGGCEHAFVDGGLVGVPLNCNGTRLVFRSEAIQPIQTGPATLALVFAYATEH